MTKQQFVSEVLSGFGANTSIVESYTYHELVGMYDQFLLTRPAKSPLRTDNKLSRQAFLTELYEEEKQFWAQQPTRNVVQDKAFMRQVLGNVIKLKKRVRDEGIAATPSGPLSEPAVLELVTDEIATAESIYDAAYGPLSEQRQLVNVVSGVETPFIDGDVDGTNTFEAMYS
jgi:hypothetical protein